MFYARDVNSLYFRLPCGVARRFKREAFQYIVMVGCPWRDLVTSVLVVRDVLVMFGKRPIRDASPSFRVAKTFRMYSVPSRIPARICLRFRQSRFSDN